MADFASLTDLIDDRPWGKGMISKFGPVTLIDGVAASPLSPRAGTRCLRLPGDHSDMLDRLD